MKPNEIAPNCKMKENMLLHELPFKHE